MNVNRSFHTGSSDFFFTVDDTLGPPSLTRSPLPTTQNVAIGSELFLLNTLTSTAGRFRAATR